MSNVGEKLIIALITIITLICVGLLGFGMLSGFLWIICWAFGLTFSLKVCVGIYAILVVLRLIIK